MISADIYKVIHLSSLAFLLIALAALIGSISGKSVKKDGVTKFFAAVHGLSLAILLISGFGMLARLGYDNWPGWVIGKVLIFIAVAGILGLIYRKPGLKFVIFFLLGSLVSLSAYLAVLKPF